MAFSDLSGLALRLEDVFDQQKFPQAYQRMRTFLRENVPDGCAASEPDQGMCEELVGAQHGEVMTFELLVVSRKNCSWQGLVNWLDGSERQKFASFLDLLRLIEQRVCKHVVQ